MRAKFVNTRISIDYEILTDTDTLHSKFQAIQPEAVLEPRTCSAILENTTEIISHICRPL